MIHAPNLSGYVGLDYEGIGSCWGLVRRVYADILGIDLPLYDTVPGIEGIAAARAARAAQRGWQEIPLGEERPLDVILLNAGTHVGLVVRRPEMLHVERGRTSTIERYDLLRWSGRIASIHRWPA